MKLQNSYQLSPEVYMLSQDGLIQFLDFHQGKFYGLDAMASKMFDLTIKQGVEATITEITQTYDVDEEEVRQDLNQLLKGLKRKKLLIRQNQSLNNTIFLSLLHPIESNLLKLLKLLFYVLRKGFNPQTTPNRLTVNSLLILSWISFRLLGWSKTVKLWQHWHQTKKKIINSKISEILPNVHQLVSKAATSQLFLPIVCKERALVGYHLLRTFYGLPATLVIGIDPYPLQIHAWVESEGIIITDEAEHCKLFSPLLNYV